MQIGAGRSSAGIPTTVVAIGLATSDEHLRPLLTELGQLLPSAT